MSRGIEIWTMLRKQTRNVEFHAIWETNKTDQIPDKALRITTIEAAGRLTEGISFGEMIEETTRKVEHQRPLRAPKNTCPVSSTVK